MEKMPANVTKDQAVKPAESETKNQDEKKQAS
jgi:hypothetical protein